MNTSQIKPGAGGFWFRQALPGQVLENGYKTEAVPQRTHATPAEYFAESLAKGMKLKGLRYANIACDGVEWPMYPGHITLDAVMKGKTPAIMAEAMQRPEAVAAMQTLAAAYEAAGIKL